MRKTDLVMDCPGAWYGNNPTAEFASGNVVIDPAKAVQAIRWLSKRAVIEEAEIKVHRAAGGDGLLLPFRLRQEQVEFAS